MVLLYRSVHNSLEDECEVSRLSLLFRKVWQLRLGMIGGIIIICLVSAAIFAPFVAPQDPYSQNIMKRLLPPSWMAGGLSEHLLGTDHLGRDVLSRIIYGSRVSLAVGISAVLLEVAIGVALGLLAGYYGGKVDSVISFLVNCMMGFPFILLALSLVAVPDLVCKTSLLLLVSPVGRFLRASRE